MILSFFKFQEPDASATGYFFLLQKYKSFPIESTGKIAFDSFEESLRKLSHDKDATKIVNQADPEDPTLTKLNTSCHVAFKSISDKFKKLSEVYLIYKNKDTLYSNTPPWFVLNFPQTGALIESCRLQNQVNKQWQRLTLEENNKNFYISLFAPAKLNNVHPKKNWIQLSTYIQNIHDQESESLTYMI